MSAGRVIQTSPLRWRGPSGREDKSSRAEPGRRTLGFGRSESTQCVCWPARSTRSASAVAGAGRRRHRTWAHAKPQLRADRERGRATDDAARLEIGEHEVRSSPALRLAFMFARAFCDQHAFVTAVSASGRLDGRSSRRADCSSCLTSDGRSGRHLRWVVLSRARPSARVSWRPVAPSGSRPRGSSATCVTLALW